MKLVVFPNFRVISLKQFFKELYRHWDDHAVLDKAAQLSYYFLFALFPLLFFLVTLAAYLPIVELVENLLDRASDIVPPSALNVIQEHLDALLHRPRPKLLTLGFVVTIWSASRGVDAIRIALNLAYEVKESRPYWKTQLLAIVMTIAGALLIVLAVAMVVLGGKAGYSLASQAQLGQVYLEVWRWARWPVTAIVVMLAVALTYYLLPDVKQEFKLITPGSVVAALIWMLAAWGFTKFGEHFGNYNVTYGAIGSVIVLLTWFYISGVIFIMGGEINAIIEHASAEGKAEGAKAPGEPPPPKEERSSAVPPGAVKSAGSAQQVQTKL